MKTNLIDEELYPPFDGFPEEGINFLKKLKRNNNRPWFTKHKNEYEEFVKFPIQSLIATLALTMREYAPDIEVNPKRSMYRIYRDTRFSSDKTPYKTHAAAHFTLKGKGRDTAGYYVHIEPGEIYIGGGIYAPNPEQLRGIRRAIARDSDAFLEIVTDRKFKKTFGEVVGDRLTRVPQGFDKDHPLKDYLCMKQFYAGASLEEKACTTPAFTAKVHSHFRTIGPLVDFLNAAIR